MHCMQLYIYINISTDEITDTDTDTKVNIDVGIDRYYQKDQVSGSDIRLYLLPAVIVGSVPLQHGSFYAQHLLQSDERHMNKLRKLFYKRGIQKYKFLCLYRGNTAVPTPHLRKGNNSNILHIKKFSPLQKRGRNLDLYPLKFK